MCLPGHVCCAQLAIHVSLGSSSLSTLEVERGERRGGSSVQQARGSRGSLRIKRNSLVVGDL